MEREANSRAESVAIGRSAASGWAAFALIALSVLALSVAPVPAEAGELVIDGGFETGGFSQGWVDGAGSVMGPLNPNWADHLVSLDMPLTGKYSALLGFKYTNPQQHRYGFMYYDVTIPADISEAPLTFSFRQMGYDGEGRDPFNAEVRDTDGNTLAPLVSYTFPERSGTYKDSGWIAKAFDMAPFAGQTVRLYFEQVNSGDNSYETWVFVDDVSLRFSSWIDLVVDGDGDDLFGDPGTGSGGSSIQSVLAGGTVVYELLIENEGTEADSDSIDGSFQAGWSAVIRYGGTDYDLPWIAPVIPAGADIVAEVVVTVPLGEAVGGYSAIVDAVSVTDSDRHDSVTLATNVVPVPFQPDLAIDGDGFGLIDWEGGNGGSSMQVAVPDTVIDYMIELLNDGAEADSFRVSFAEQTPLSAVVVEGATVYTGEFSTPLVPPGGTISYTLRITVPAVLSGGIYETLLFARSLGDTLRGDGVTAVMEVLAPAIDLIISGSGDGIIDPTGAGLGGSSTIIGTRDQTVYFPVVFQNEGTVTDSFTVSWTRPANGWSAVITDGVNAYPLPWVTPAFAPGEERTYFLAVTISNKAQYTSYRSILDVVSETDGTVRESVAAIVAVSSVNEIDLWIDGNGDDIYGPLGTGLGGASLLAAGPADTLDFEITLENESGEDLFDLAWSAPPGWEVAIGDSTGTMSGVTSGVYQLEVRIPAGCPGGTYEIILDGWKTNKTYLIDSVKGTILVTRSSIVDALVDGDGDGLYGAPGLGDGGFAMRSTIGGTRVSFQLELQNEGDDAESYGVSWNGFVGFAEDLDGNPSPLTTIPVAAGTSELFTFSVDVPLTAAAGDYDYIIDVISTSDSTSTESVTARVHVDDASIVDLVAEGDGAFVMAPVGTGGGGRAVLFGEPGTVVTASLEVHNRGGSADSVRITWSEPAGWPAGSVILSDGIADYGSSFVTGPIAPDAMLAYTVRIFIPAGASFRSSFIVDGVAVSSGFEDSVTLEIMTASFIAVTVFDDADHDGAYDPGEVGISGVTVRVTDPAGDIGAVTGAGGSYIFEVDAGTGREVIEINPSGMFSLSADTVSVGPGAAGDTTLVFFADVMGPMIAPNGNLNAPAGGFVDFPHTITAGTTGQASLAAAMPAGWVEVFYRDNNGDGLLDPGDTPLTAADLDLDPTVPGRDVVPVILRVFIPPETPVGTVEVITVTLEQVFSGTAVAVSVSVLDRISVLAGASGLLRLVKEVDLTEGYPGDVVTYTIVFSNPGAEDVREIEIIDYVSDALDIVADAFGPGQDVAWVNGGVTTYLTFDPADPDEAMFLSADRSLHVLLSRQIPFVLASGEEGRIIYRVRIR
jgi:uncharacterized repeat protein (TIGR01451 family)